MQRLAGVLCLVLCLSSLALARVLVQSGAVPSGCGADYCEDFEGTGAPTNWSGGGVNWDNATTPLEGLQSVSAGVGFSAVYDPSYNALTQTWTLYFNYGDTLEAVEAFFTVRDSANATLATFRLDPVTPEWECLAQGGTLNTGGNPTAPETYVGPAPAKVIVKLLFTTGTGSNAVATMWQWLSGAWTQVCSSVNGTATANVDNVLIAGGQNAAEELFRFDLFKTSATDIADPT